MTETLHVERLGKGGPPLILLHGWGQDSSHLRYLGELLSWQRDVHLIDLPGFGKSAPPGGVWSSFDYAKCLVRYLDKQKIQTADFIGHSFGGKVALSLAIEYSSRIRRLAALAPSGLKPHRSYTQRGKFITIKWSGKAAKFIDRFCGSQFFSSYFIPKFGSSDYKNAGAMRPILVKSVNEDLSHLLPRITAPVLLIWGDKDSQTPKEMAERMNHLIPKSKLLRFPHHDHDLHKDSGAHLCAFHILPFLGEDL